MWNRIKATEQQMKFTTRAEAFAYMLKWQLEEKKADPMEAAEKANQFAEIFAVNTGVPGKSEPEPKGIDKYMQMADKVVCYCDDHPRLVEYVTGAATFLVGLIAGKKIDNNSEPPPPVEPVDFNKID